MRVIGQEQVAELFGVAPKTIVAWQDDGLPIALRGSPGIPSEYESEACINWLVAREVLKVQGERPQDRLARVHADKIDMENEVSRGRLIPADQLEPKLRAAMIAAREAWRNEPMRLARDVPGRPIKEIEEMLSTAFDQFLTRLSRWPEAHVVEASEDGE